MAEEKVERTIMVDASPARSWEVLTDVDLLASWVGIVHSVKEVKPLSQYTAVLEDKVGPFKLRADLKVGVEVISEGERISVSASGRDRAVDSKITIEAELALSEGDGGRSIVHVTGRYQVTGKAASMGAGIIRKKGDKVVDEFFDQAKAALG